MEKLSDAIKAYVEFKIEANKPLYLIPGPGDLENHREKERQLKENIDLVVGEILSNKSL